MRYMYVFRLGAFVLAVLSVGGAVAAGLGTRWGLWHFRTGITILAWAAYGGLAAAVLGLVVLVLDRSSWKTALLAFSTVVRGAVVAGFSCHLKQRGQQGQAYSD